MNALPVAVTGIGSSTMKDAGIMESGSFLKLIETVNRNNMAAPSV
jgi:hypothetical protein